MANGGRNRSGRVSSQLPVPALTKTVPPGLFTAIQEQLGLKLEPTKAPVDVLMIDRLEKPSEN